MFAVSVFRDRELGRSEVTQIHPLLLTTDLIRCDLLSSRIIHVRRTFEL